MAMIHVNRSGNTLGIYDEERVREGLRTGEFIGTDLGWMEGMAAWRPLSELESFRTPTAAAAAPVTPQIPTTTTTAATPTALPPRRTEPLAICSLVLSILGLVGFLCCGFILSVPGVICGHLALGKISRDPSLEGHALAKAGLIIGYIAIAIWLINVVFFGGVAFLRGLTEHQW